MPPKTDAGVLSALFDFSFREFLTPRIVRLSYGLNLGLIAIAALWLIILGLGMATSSPGAGLVFLIAAVALSLVLLIAARMFHEMVVVFFRIADHAQEVAEQGAQVALNTAREGWRLQSKPALGVATVDRSSGGTARDVTST